MAADTNPRHSMPPGGYHGRNGGSPGLPRSPAPPLPHIQDLVAIPKDINPNQSIRKLLEQAESSFKQSEMHRDFNKPAIALKDYIRAFVIAVEIIHKHQEYPVMKSKQGDAFLLHKALLSKIGRQSELYDQIKKDIIADNQKTGVQPTVKNPSAFTNPTSLSTLSLPATNNVGARSLQHQAKQPQQLPNGHVSQLPNGGSPAKSKPVVHPKPPSLHGNAIPPRHNRTNSANNVTLDLAARFANLRGPQPSPGQDPRIKTYPIIPQKPAGPRQMPPSPSRMNTNTDNEAPLPKLPDAIYSPVRGSVSGEAARLPTSTPRGLFSRTGSSTSVPGTPSANQSRQNDEYFPPVAPSPPKVPAGVDKVVKIPGGDAITPEGILEIKASILYIDVRPRKKFNEGHIMAASIICIEPNILHREDMTCSDISESLILSPQGEKALFDKREEYDLIVFYDEDSKCLPLNNRDPHGASALWSLNRALVELSYGKELKNAPKILKGGLNAWKDVYGAASLRSTTNAETQPETSKTRSFIKRQGSKYVFNPLTKNEVEVFENVLKKDEAPSSFPRTRDEFLRFPPVSTDKQSMTSVVSAEQRYKQDFATKFSSPAQMLAPPTRPQAAVQRPSHISLSQDGHDDHGPAEQISAVPAKAHTGLHNPSNWCYANSTLQSLLASPNFGRELADSAWAARYKNRVPRKTGEKMDQPQLMIQMLSNIFCWMSSGKFQTMKAQMLMDYSKHLCATGDPSTKFGGPDQQDAQEFMSFLMDQIHDETNLKRDVLPDAKKPDTQGKQLVQAAADYWDYHKKSSDSIVDEYWRGLQLSTVRCDTCSTQTYTFSQFEWLGVNVSDNRDMNLTEALRDDFAGSIINDFVCNKCEGRRKAIISESLARMPPLLCVSFRRFKLRGSGGIEKSTRAVKWDFNDVDFTPYFLNSDEDRKGAFLKDRAFSGPFRYECYAVIVHKGQTTSSGHYYAYVRDSSTHDPYAWYLCNDSNVTKVRIGSNDQADIQSKVFKSGTDAVPYLAFFRRKNT